MSQKVVDILKEKFAAVVLETKSEHKDETAVVEASAWFEVAQFLRDDPRCDMQMMVDLCGVDFPDREPRFEVVMHLHSIRLKHRLRLKARVGDRDGDEAKIKSVVPIWSGANWFERETYDLMGIEFTRCARTTPPTRSSPWCPSGRVTKSFPLSTSSKG
jgi:NADH-quinone oxidoreductase subunit C